MGGGPAPPPADGRTFWTDTTDACSVPVHPAEVLDVAGRHALRREARRLGEGGRQRVARDVLQARGSAYHPDAVRGVLRERGGRREGGHEVRRVERGRSGGQRE